MASHPEEAKAARAMADIYGRLKQGLLSSTVILAPHPASDCPNEASLLLPNCHQI